MSGQKYMHLFWDYCIRLLCPDLMEGSKQEFDCLINEEGLKRARIVSGVLIVLESVMFLLSFFTTLIDLEVRDWYRAMYGIMAVAMIFFWMLFTHFERSAQYDNKKIHPVFIVFTSFIIMWCAGITLLDQLSYGQPTVYLIAVVCVGFICLYRPLELLFICATIHVFFLLLLPHFLHSATRIFGTGVNTTIGVLLACILQAVMYKGKVDEYNNFQMMEQKNRELVALTRRLREVNNELQHLAQTDGLTGIYNRKMFNTSLDILWDKCRVEEVPLSLFMLDIDFFKAYNDGYGHQMGDDCLIRIASLLSKAAIRIKGLLARYGGEEFCIIAEGFDQSEAAAAAEQIRAEIEDLHIQHGFSKIMEFVTASIGVYTVIPMNEMTPDQFIRMADRALYEAKAAGRNRVSVA